MKLTLELEGSAEDLRLRIEALARALLDDQRAGGAVEGVTIYTEEVSYWREHVDELLRRISDDAKRALKFLCENAPVVSREDLNEFLGIDGVALGGVMASFGFAENAMGRRPYTKITGRRYRVDPEVARVLLSALDRAAVS